MKKLLLLVVMSFFLMGCVTPITHNHHGEQAMNAMAMIIPLTVSGAFVCDGVDNTSPEVCRAYIISFGSAMTVWMFIEAISYDGSWNEQGYEKK